MNPVLQSILRIPHHNANVADFLFSSLTKKHFHPSYPLTSFSADNTLAFHLTRTSHPATPPAPNFPIIPDIWPDVLPTDQPTTIHASASITHVDTTASFLLGYGFIDFQLIGAQQNALTNASGTFRFICDTNTNDYLAVTYAGNPPCIVIRAFIKTLNHPRRVFVVAVPPLEYKWPHLPTFPLCIVSDISVSSSKPPPPSPAILLSSTFHHSSHPDKNSNHTNTPHSNTLCTSTTNNALLSNDEYDKAQTIPAPLSPIAPQTPFPSPLSPSSEAPASSSSLFSGLDPIASCTMLPVSVTNNPCSSSYSSSSSSFTPTQAPPLPPSLGHMWRAVMGKFYSPTVQFEVATGQISHTGPTTTTVELISPARATRLRECLRAHSIVVLNPRLNLCKGRCSWCGRECPSSHIHQIPHSTPHIQTEHLQAKLDDHVRHPPAIAPAVQSCNAPGTDSVLVAEERNKRLKQMALRRERNRQSAARSNKRKREREAALEHGVACGRARVKELQEIHSLVKAENSRLKRLLGASQDTAPLT